MLGDATLFPFFFLRGTRLGCPTSKKSEGIVVRYLNYDKSIYISNISIVWPRAKDNIPRVTDEGREEES